MAGITFYNFYFRLYKGSVKTAEAIEFLEALLRHIPGRLLIVWDRLPAHRSKTVREFIEAQGDRLWMEFLPAYAPELNPVEYIWAYWKQHALPNVCPKDYWSLDETARKTLKRMRRRRPLIAAFWQQAELPF
jgi:transposase